MAQAKLKILCLHGYRQNGKDLESKVNKLSLKDTATFDWCPDAPHVVPASVDPPMKGGFGWVLVTTEQEKNLSHLFLPESDLRKFDGYQDSCQYLSKYVAEHGPFDGIVAFSQGGVILSAMLAEEQHPFTGIKFIIFMSTYGMLAERALPEAVQKIPTLHLIGVKDNFIPNDASRKLAAAFSDATIVEHDGGHVVPNKGVYKQAIKAFLLKCK